MTPFLQLVLCLMIIITAAKTGGWLAVRLRQPAVLGELLIGVLLGPSLLDLLHWPVLANPAEPHLLTEAVYELAELGVICLMFLAGLEIELDEMRHAGRVAMLAGVSGVIVPLVMGALAVWPFGYRGNAALFAGVTLTATSVSISAQTLLELGVLRRREGIALLGAAVVDDVLVILILSLFLALSSSAASLTSVLFVLAKMVVYLAAALATSFLLLPRLVVWVDRQPISQGLAALVFVAALAFAWTAEIVGGLAAITGAFIAGMGLGRSRLRAEIGRSMHTITYAFLVPIFFVSIGLKTDTHLLAWPMFLLAGVMVLVAIFSKIIGCGIGARLGGFTNREALRVGLGMVSRGEVGLIVAAVGVNEGIIEPNLFAVVTIIVLVTTLVTPLFLRQAFAHKELSHA